MRIDTRFKILGYPGLAILFFLAAGIAAAWLVANVMIHDMRAAKSSCARRSRRRTSTEPPRIGSTNTCTLP